jgi:1-acyl-sn-glycerol-3-phosphate acyltransferase
MLSVVVTTYIVPPFLYRLITTKKGKYREEPLTLKNSFYSAFAFLFFIFGSVYLTLTGFFLLTLGGRTDKHKLVFHKRLAKVSAFVLFRVPEVKTQLINKYRADFDKPSVIIANHQSHLDLMALIMLHPKIIILTNRRTWHSPFYGLIIRYADFLRGRQSGSRDYTYQVHGTERLFCSRFPRGDTFQRLLHPPLSQGAFHLAQELGLDITPVLLHGFGHVLPKEDLLLRKGQMTVEILPVLRREDILFSKTLAEQSRIVKNIYCRICQDSR